MDRRQFLRSGIAAAGAATTVPLVARAAGAQTAGTSPYGSLDGIAPDGNGIILPPGFTSRVVAVAGEEVGDTGHVWHAFPDGAATFDDGQGGWYHCVNSEVFVAGAAGVGAIHYGPDGEILAAYPVLTGSEANCGGGPSPWGTFLSGEEVFTTGGVLWEVDPTGATEAQARTAMGIFTHEAAAVDPVREHVYMTEDQPDGRLYRFTPDAYPDLASGLLEMAFLAEDGSVSWLEVPDPSAADTPCRQQLPDTTTAFLGGEGIWYHDGVVFFSTKYDNVIHAIDVVDQRHEVIYAADPDAVAAGTAVLSGVDNLTVDAGTGDVFVAEDGGNMEIVVITPDGEVAPFLRVVDQEQSEITGPVFNPARDRLYFSSQRGPSTKPLREINDAIDSDDAFGGVTYEVTGPFRGVVEAAPETTTTTEATTTSGAPAPEETTTIPSPTTTIAQATQGDDDDGNGSAVAVGVGVAVAVAAGAGVLGLRRRGG